MKDNPSADEYMVYWAKLPLDRDPYTEGYVGITSTKLSERIIAHRKVRNRGHRFGKVLVKYGHLLEWQILHESLSREEALVLELRYRPSINIGWNSIPGGTLGVSPEWYGDEENRQEHRLRTAEATKTAIAEKDNPEARSARAKEVWERPGYREGREGMFAGENNPQFGKFGKDHPAWGYQHTDTAKEAIAEAHRGRPISPDQRAKISQTRIKKFAKQKAARQARLEEERQQRKSARMKAIQAGELKGEVAGPSRVSDKQRREICVRRRQGETYAAIAADYPICLTAIRAICQDWGPHNGFPFESKIGVSKIKKVTPPESKTEICRKYADGQSAAELARQYGLSQGAIYKFLAEWGPANGVPYRRRRDR